MACKLTPSATGAADFEAPSASRVTMSVSSNNPPGTLRLIGVAYDGAFIAGPQPVLTLTKGIKAAVAVLAAATNGERGKLNEECGGGATQELMSIVSSDNPTRILFLEGK